MDSADARPGFFASEGTRSFLLLWIGLTISLLGSGLTAFSLGVWIFQKTASTTQYGLVMFSSALPPLLVLPFVGPIIDRVPRKRLLVICDLVGAAATATIGLLAWWKLLSLAWACAIVIVTSSVSALQWPTYSATVTTLVPRAELGRASGMTQLAQALSQIASPVLAGALITTIGLFGITAIDFVTFVVSTLLLIAARIPRVERRERRRGDYWRDLPLGWRTIAAEPGLLGLLLMFAATNFLAELASILFTPLVLSFAPPAALGTIVAIGGVGLLLGGATLTLTGGPKRPAFGAAIFAALGGVAIAAAGVTVRVPLLAAIAACFFFSVPMMSGSSQVVWQRIVPAEIQGRVFAARATVAMSAVPLASLLAGPLADRLLEPAMREGGRLSPVFGGWIGVGPGRGIALILVFSGVLSVAVALAAASFAPLRRLDSVSPREPHSS